MKSRPHRDASAWLFRLSCVYATVLAALVVLTLVGADRWWFGAMNLYLPQVMWVVPGALLLGFSLKFCRHWIWAPLLCVAVVLGPIMGFRWPLHSPQSPAGSLSLRVMTWNVKDGRHDKRAESAIIHDIDRNTPDVVLFQDAANVLAGPLGDYFRKWHVRSSGQYIVASRFPLSEAEERWISFPGQKQNCLRCQLQIGTASITLYNVHFKSPREGLNAFRTLKERPWYLPEAVQQLEDNVQARLIQACAIGAYLRQEQGPVIVAGDLNSSDASLVCSKLRESGLHDAFAEGGRGYGYTYGHYLLQNRLPWLTASWMRIDHVMMSAQLQTRSAWTGTWKASDHRPVIADLVVKLP